MVSLPIDLVSHPKIPVSLRCETSETGGSVSLFREKKFHYVSLQVRFEAKFGDTLAVACLVRIAVATKNMYIYRSDSNLLHLY